jgi:hypothetical protein
MPPTVASESRINTKSIRHEEFCLPRPGEKEPRVEGFVAYADDAQTGRSRPAAFVSRCLECGAAVYDPQN